MRTKIGTALSLMGISLMLCVVSFYHGIFTHPLYALPGCLALMCAIGALSAYLNLRSIDRKREWHASAAR